jgi:hypothetical protein
VTTNHRAWLRLFYVVFNFSDAFVLASASELWLLWNRIGKSERKRARERERERGRKKEIAREKEKENERERIRKREWER